MTSVIDSEYSIFAANAPPVSTQQIRLWATTAREPLSRLNRMCMPLAEVAEPSHSEKHIIECLPPTKVPLRDASSARERSI